VTATSNSPSATTTPLARRDIYVPLALFAFALALRWPLRGGAVEEFDSVNYSGAVQRFDLPNHFPHPSGYIFLIWTARILEPFTHDPVRSLSSLAALSGAAAVALLYLLGRPFLGPLAAAAAALSVTFCGQVWFQHVRPMSDAYASLWQIAVVCLVVWAWNRTGWPWLAAMFLFGAAAGAKQLLWLFLAGLLAHAVLDRLRRRGLADAARGVVAFAAGVLSWLVPLSVLCGSPRAYFAWVNEEVANQQPRETIFVGAEGMLHQQAIATFDLVWLRSPWPWIIWPLALVGIWTAARRGPRWLVSVTLPAVVVRFALLGYWPRFSIYYAPWVLLLAVTGFAWLARRLRLRPTVVAATGLLLLGSWCLSQTRAVLPTLTALHRAVAPVEAALRYARSHYDPEETLVICDYALLGRQAQYLAPRLGVRYVMEGDLQPVQIKAARHLLKLQSDQVARADAAWSSDVVRLGTWTVDIPAWRQFSPAGGTWQASLFELRGAMAIFRNWRKEEDPVLATVRHPRPEGSTITVLHAPPQGFDLRLKLAPAAAGVPPYAAGIVINGVRRIEWRGASDASVRVSASESVPRALIEVFSRCGASGACFPVTGYEVVAVADRASS
jgi:4-amino-4-deoxy-L-arabinose transferase-like glycosyltransferase